MNPLLQQHLVSALQTFLATFLVFLGTSLANGGIEWTAAFWGAVVLAAARAAVKETFAKYAPLALGGRK